MLLAKSLLGFASVTESKIVPLSTPLLKGGTLNPISGGTGWGTERAPKEGNVLQVQPRCSRGAAGEAVLALAGMLGAKKTALTQRETEKKSVCSKEETNEADGVLCESAGLH